MRIMMTGASGFIGRHLLFEYLKTYQNRLGELGLCLLGRDRPGMPFSQRILRLFMAEGSSYIGAPAETVSRIIQFLKEKTLYLSADLNTPALLSEENKQKAAGFRADTFFHFAASPDLRNTQTALDKTLKNNLQGTQNTLQLIDFLQIKDFNYVSTAYVAGKTAGLISPEYLNSDQEFTNPYERSKALAEAEVRRFGKEKNIRLRCFRPSVVSGRLLEKPEGHTTNFNVFYEIFSFLFLLKLKHFGSEEAAVKNSFSVPLRAAFDPEKKINIAAVDYVVKLMRLICESDLPGIGFHLCNDRDTSFGEFLSGAIEVMKIEGIEAVNTKPERPNPAEAAYYEKSDTIFGPYFDSPAKQFDTSNHAELRSKAALICPPVNQTSAKTLISYALKRRFGYDISAVLQMMKKGM